MKVSRTNKNRTSVLAFAVYRREIEKPLFSPYSIFTAMNNEVADGKPLRRLGISGVSISEFLRQFEDAGHVQVTPHNGQATFDENPYLNYTPSRQVYPRGWYSITDSGEEHLASSLAGLAHGEAGATIRDIIRPAEVALTIVRLPKVQEAIWEGITGFPASEINPGTIQGDSHQTH